MKKFTLVLLSILLIVALMTTPVFATGDGSAAVTSASGKPGETVTLTVSTSGYQEVAAIGITYTVPEGLEFVSAQWAPLPNTLMPSVDTARMKAAWVGTAAINLSESTPIFTITYKILEPQVGQTDFSYEANFIVKTTLNSDTLGTPTATGTVTVVNPATALALDKQTMALDLSGTKTDVLTATVTPANSSDLVSWTSSDSSVATVSGGTVTAVKEGTATITATAGSFSKTCVVTVSCGHTTMNQTAAQPSSCQATGNNEYWTCSTCNKVFKSDKTTETSVEAETLDKVPHSGGTATCYAQAICTMCNNPYGNTLEHSYSSDWQSDANNHWKPCTTPGCTAKNEDGAHSYFEVVDTPATATENGIKHEECECGVKRNEGTVIPHTHSMSKHASVAATCNATGTVEYWTCASTLCDGIYYTDENRSATLTADQLVTDKDASNHTGGTELKNVKAATCYEKGYTGDTWCLGCDTKLTDGTEIDLTAHTATTWEKDDSKHWQICTVTACGATFNEANHNFVWVEDKAATATENGIEHEECECGAKRNENTVIPHTHSMSKHAAVAATCIAEGNVEYWTCASTHCAGIYYTDEYRSDVFTTIVTAINPSNHTGTEVRNAKAPSCYEKGYSGDTYCTGCDKKVETGTELAMTEHVAGTTWYSNETDHWHKCTTDGCTADVGKAAHNFIWKVDKEATEDVTGLKHEECKACAYKRNEGTEIPKLDHKHIGITHHAAVAATCTAQGNVEYWTCSSNKCAGKYYADAKCQLELTSIVEDINANNHVGSTELRGTVEATCATAGYSGDTYCGSCKALIKKGVEVPATGKHTPKEGYLIDEKQHWQECVDCGTLINNAKVEHTFTWVEDKKPTETTEGVKHEECTVCQYARSKDTPIDKLKHSPYRVVGKAATCTENGNVEHFYCPNCGGRYASDDGKIGKMISHNDTVLLATGHIYGTEWVTDEENHWKVCECGEISELSAHETVLTGVVEATETEAGYTGDTVCSICEVVLTSGETIPCLVVETEPTEEPTVVPTETAPEQDDNASESSGSPIIWIILVLAGAGIIIFFLLFAKKRKKDEE